MLPFLNASNNSVMPSGAALKLDLLATSLLIPVPPDSDQPETLGRGVTLEDYVNLRTGPGTSFKIIAQLPDETRVDIHEEQTGWFRVETSWGRIGWVADDYLALQNNEDDRLSNDQAARLATGVSVTEGLHLRTGPGTQYGSKARLSQGLALEILSQQGNWYEVRTPAGTVGWSSAEFVALDGPIDGFGAEVELPASALSSPVARLAHRYLGARYVWGGATPNGFDCSGFTRYVYDQLDVWLPRTADKQLNTAYGELVRSIDALQPGDLVFFDRTTSDPGITHVGIYIGDGLMLSARSERLGVSYVSLDEPFWNSRYWVGLRPYL